MADPFEALRETRTVRAPEPALIRARARKIQTRRYAALGTSVGVVLLVLGVGIVLPRAMQTRGVVAQQSAEEQADTTTAADGAGAGTLAEDTGAAQVAPQAASPPSGYNLSEGAAAPESDREGRAATAASQAGPSQERVGAKAVEALEITLSISKNPFTPSQEVTFTAKACNTAPHEVRVTFPSAQRFDVDVARDGDVIWRWAHDMAFAQSIQDELLAAGQCIEHPMTWNGHDNADRPLPPGPYEATATVSSSPSKRGAPIQVCSVRC